MSDTEVADVSRDVAALLRAGLRGDDRGMEAVLGGAGALGTRRIAMMLTGIATDAVTRWMVTASLVTDKGPKYDAAMAADTGLLLAQPEIRAAVDACIASWQAEIISGG